MNTIMFRRLPWKAPLKTLTKTTISTGPMPRAAGLGQSRAGSLGACHRMRPHQVSRDWARPQTERREGPRALPIAMALEPPPSSSMPSRARDPKDFEQAMQRNPLGDRQKQQFAPLIDGDRGPCVGSAVSSNHTRPSCSPTPCPPMPHFAALRSAAAGGFAGRRCGFNWSSNHRRYVCSQTWFTA